MRNIMSQEESNNPILKTTHEAMDYATVSNSSSSNNSTAPSDRRKKQVFAIRHGQSEWNVAIQQYYDKQVERRWCPETYKPDCNITVKGRQQALEAGKELSQLLQGQCYSIIASPLRRAIQVQCSSIAPKKKDVQLARCRCYTVLSF